MESTNRRETGQDVIAQVVPREDAWKWLSGALVLTSIALSRIEGSSGDAAAGTAGMISPEAAGLPSAGT